MSGDLWCANGQTNVKLRVFIPDTLSLTGNGKTGLTKDSVGLIISTLADNEAATTNYKQSDSTIETIATLGMFVAPTATKCRFKEVDAANQPGVYELQIADARWAVSGATYVDICIPPVTGLSTGMYRTRVRLTAVNPQDAAAFGMSRLDTTVSSRLASASYTAPDNAGINAIGTIVSAIQAVVNLFSFTGNDVKATLDSEQVVVATNNDKTGYGLADGAITAAKIANGALTLVKFGSDTFLKLRKYIQLQMRKDAAIATDNAAELAEINADGGSGAGAFTNLTDSTEALADSTVDLSGIENQLDVIQHSTDKIGAGATLVQTDVDPKGNVKVYHGKKSLLRWTSSSTRDLEGLTVKFEYYKNSFDTEVSGTPGDWLIECEFVTDVSIPLGGYDGELAVFEGSQEVTALTTFRVTVKKNIGTEV